MTLARLQRTWDALGRTDPLWAVLTDPARKCNRWDEEEFYTTGVADVERLATHLGELHVPARNARALDFGCGVGRITFALARRFDEVVGVDIAPAMIDFARKRDRANRCRFILNAAPDLSLFCDGYFDLVYCRLVLQHVPPACARAYIREFVRVAAPDGAIVFQLPTPSVDRQPAHQAARVLPQAVLRNGRRIKRLIRRWTSGGAPVIEDYGLPLEETLALLHEAGARVLAVTADQSHGTDRPGYQYVSSPSRAPAI